MPLPTPRRKRLSQLLQNARKDAGLTQTEAGMHLTHPGKHEAAQAQEVISRAENGKRYVSFIELEDFAQKYGKPLDYFSTWDAASDARLQEAMREYDSQDKI